MKQYGYLACAFLALNMALTGCGPQKATLHLYTWADYIDPELVTSFEAAHNCRVKIDTFDSNETMYAKMMAGSGQYDLVFPSSYQIVLMKEQNLLQPFDKAQLPQVEAQFDRMFEQTILNPDRAYNIPYAVTFTGIAYRKDKMEVPPTSWTVYTNEAYKGRASLLNDQRETIGAALKCLGYSLNTTKPEELEKAKEMLLQWKKNVAKFDNEQYKTGIASGEFNIVQGYSGDIAQLMQEDAEKIDWVFPSEGFSTACDEMVIPKNAKQVALAHAFVNFMYEPDHAAKNIQYICAAMPNKGGIAKLPEAFRSNPAICPTAEILGKAEVIRDLGDKNALYMKVWDAVKGAQ
jgi:spermidine/putrescine transport system substrate-binding protein